MNILPILNPPENTIGVARIRFIEGTSAPLFVVDHDVDPADYAHNLGNPPEQTIILHPDGEALFINTTDSFRSSPTVTHIDPKSSLYDTIRTHLRNRYSRIYNLIEWINP